MSRKFLSVLLTVALVLCFMPVAGASSNLNIVDIDILDKMDDIHSALSEASKRGVYEDTYGGMYYDNVMAALFFSLPMPQEKPVQV